MSVDILKSRADIVEVMVNYGISFEKQVRDEYWAPCPFHKEKTPSFHASRTKQTFYCFGCGARGDVLTFLQEYLRLDWWEGVEKLEAITGTTLAEIKGKIEPAKKLGLNEALSRLIKKRPRNFDEATEVVFEEISYPEYFHRIGSPEIPEINAYAYSRGFSFKYMYRLGFGGCSGGSYYGRLIIPVIENEKLMFYQAREALGREELPRYLNPKKEKTSRSPSDFLFNLEHAISTKKREVFIVEGIFGSMRVCSVNNETACVATFGNKLSDRQVRLLKKHFDDPVLFFDADTFWYKRAKDWGLSQDTTPPVFLALEKLFQRFSEVRVIILKDEGPDELSPDEIEDLLIFTGPLVTKENYKQKLFSFVKAVLPEPSLSKKSINSL